MRVFSVKCACISDPLVEVILDEVKQFVLEEWKDCLKEKKKISDGLNSIKFLKFDQILQQQLYNISFPMIRFRFFGASKTTRKLSKQPKIMAMVHFGVETDFRFERKKLTLDIKDYVFFVRRAIIIHHFDFFKSKLFYAINTCAVREFFIKLPTMDQLVKAVDLIPNVCELIIGLQDENLAINNNDFETLTRKIGNNTKLEYITFTRFNLPKIWEKICKENFKNHSNLKILSITRYVPSISINVVDLHDLMTENNISVGIYDFLDDSFIELPEFRNRFKQRDQISNGKRLYIQKNNKSYHFLPL